MFLSKKNKIDKNVSLLWKIFILYDLQSEKNSAMSISLNILKVFLVF